jgi:hypothetical protein
MIYDSERLTRDNLRDLVTEIRCARRDSCTTNDLRDYECRCVSRFRVIWGNRHNCLISRYGESIPPAQVSIESQPGCRYD